MAGSGPARRPRPRPARRATQWWPGDAGRAVRGVGQRCRLADPRRTQQPPRYAPSPTAVRTIAAVAWRPAGDQPRPRAAGTDAADRRTRCAWAAPLWRTVAALRRRTCGRTRGRRRPVRPCARAAPAAATQRA
ncbi:hypothetical protein G6F62_013757 [Rhizopus arrhizus]|nr:hypothetical protein G6F62_013757 [Rhizopus arrhizus]